MIFAMPACIRMISPREVGALRWCRKGSRLHRNGTHWLLCGWLFLVAPGAGSVLDYERDVAEWRHFMSFDKAEQCEKHREKEATRWLENKELFPGETPRNREIRVFLSMKCVPSDLMAALVGRRGDGQEPARETHE